MSTLHISHGRRWTGWTTASYSAKRATLSGALAFFVVVAWPHTLDDLSILTVQLFHFLGLLFGQIQVTVHVVVETVNREVRSHG